MEILENEDLLLFILNQLDLDSKINYLYSFSFARESRFWQKMVNLLKSEYRSLYDKFQKYISGIKITHDKEYYDFVLRLMNPGKTNYYIEFQYETGKTIISFQSPHYWYFVKEFDSVFTRRENIIIRQIIKDCIPESILKEAIEDIQRVKSIWTEMETS